MILQEGAFWPVFPRTIDYEKPHRTQCEGTLRTLSKIVQFIE